MYIARINENLKLDNKNVHEEMISYFEKKLSQQADLKEKLRMIDSEDDNNNMLALAQKCGAYVRYTVIKENINIFIPVLYCNQKIIVYVSFHCSGA